jgi:N,N'-diacetyllegionaminate synthase
MEHTIIIAEAGVNHNGNMELAKKMVESAKSFGVDYIKFQTGKPELVTSKFAMMADYQKKNIGKEESQLDMIKKIMLKAEDFTILKEYCDTIGIKFCSTPFDLTSIDVLAPLKMDFMKIPSGEITNFPYLKKIASLKMPIIMSTGMSSLGDIEAALDVLYKEGLSTNDITLLHCNTEYPTPFVDVNLKAMLTLKQCFGTKIGYSDHTKGIEVPIAAVAMGATVIEKHFTLDRTLPGPDHIASLEPNEMKQMVNAIRNIEQAMGNGLKQVTESERKNMAIARKSIVAASNIIKGEIFTEKNLTTKRPGNGISPMRWNEIIGTTAARDFKEDELIEA